MDRFLSIGEAWLVNAAGRRGAGGAVGSHGGWYCRWLLLSWGEFGVLRRRCGGFDCVPEAKALTIR
jgi:hypothetical protein